MPLSPQQERSWLGREIGSLGLCAVTPKRPELLLRVAAWRNSLARLGVSPPLYVVHDLGLILAASSDQIVVAPQARNVTQLDPGTRQVHGPYAALVREMAQSEVAERARGWRLSDDLVTVILAKLLADLWTRWPERFRMPAADLLPLDSALYQGIDEQLPSLLSAHDRALEVRFCHHVVSNRLRLLTSVEQLDLDTLRLLGLFRSGDRMAGVVDVMDLLGVLNSPQANDVVNFSLDIIPSVLETKRSGGQQSFSIDGYAGLGRSGNLDNILLSELAHDDVVFEQKFLDNEVFYYVHEKQTEQQRRLHYIVIDASASMRGDREVFARGLALALIKKLSLRGEDIYVRFFDSLLYDLVRVRGEHFDVPYLLCFRSERGRNYGKVFRMLAMDLDRTVRRERRKAVLYVITHAECHMSAEVIGEMKRSAFVYAVFILPSAGELALDYVDQLDRYHIVDYETLIDRDARANKALEICQEAEDLAAARPVKPKLAEIERPSRVPPASSD